MLFVNTITYSIASDNLQIKPEIPADVAHWFTILSIIVFILSLAIATYILISEYRKEKNLNQSDSIPVYDKDDTTLSSPIEDQMSTDILPAKEEIALPNSRSLLSAFEAVSLPAKNVPSTSESSSLSAEPIPSQLKPKPLKPKPLRPKPIPLPIEPPPAYYISNLQVEPIKATTGATIFVSFIITSNTTTSDNFPVSLKVNGFEIYSNTITLGPYESRSLTYPIRAIEPGDWDISVNNNLCKLTIIEDYR
jgi:hypothetical protein